METFERASGLRWDVDDYVGCIRLEKHIMTFISAALAHRAGTILVDLHVFLDLEGAEVLRARMLWPHHSLLQA
jgi:hypothetical protein